MKLLTLLLAAALPCVAYSTTDKHASPALPHRMVELSLPAATDTPSTSSQISSASTAAQPKMKLTPRHRWSYKTSGYSKHDDGPAWGRRFANVNFLTGGKYFDADKPYPKRLTFTGNVTGGVVAVPRWCEWVHSDRVRYPDGTWRHRWAVHVPGYGFAWPLDRITKYDRFDCYYHDDRKAASRHGVNNKWLTIYEVSFE